MAVLDIAARVVEDYVGARVLIRMLEVEVTAKLQNQGIDFDCDDAASAVA